MIAERLEPIGTTRSCVRSRYALITPDTHTPGPLEGWESTTAAVHISPELGARYRQSTLWLEADARSALPGPGVERFILVVQGAVSLEAEGRSFALSSGGYAFFPAGCEHLIATRTSAQLAMIEKRFVPHPQGSAPWLCVGDASETPGDHVQGDSALWQQNLLPNDPAFDLAVNLFTYQPGATSPQMSIQPGEQGVAIVQGAGIFRLDRDYHPVQAGDVVWIASYCPQWFAAIGKQPTQCLCYQEVPRATI